MSPRAMVMPKIDHPIKASMRLNGSEFAFAQAVASAFKAKVDTVELDRLYFSNTPPLVIYPTRGAKGYLIGEIGLSYLAYRLNAPNAAILEAFRRKDYRIIETIFTAAFREYTTLYDADIISRLVKITSIDNELVGILKFYRSVSNLDILNAIKAAGFADNVVSWVWRPLQFDVVIRNTIHDRGFYSGILISNGETGHRAISFDATLRSESLPYEFNSSISEGGYARHIDNVRLEKMIDSLDEIMKEHWLAAAFEKLTSLDGVWATMIISRELSKPWKREASLAKLTAQFEPYVALRALDVFEFLLETGAKINKSTTLIAQMIGKTLLDEAFHA